MLLTEYAAQCAETVSEYSKTGLILSSRLSVDSRTEKIGLIKCDITFVDGSKLFITEYLDLRYKTEKLAYSFHYQDKNNALIFRYDNAIHKPAMPSISHKHIKGEIVEYDAPTLKDVLEEIISDFLKTFE